jgi:hypothetical protein
VVTGSDWQVPALQQRYAGHFSPFINARLAARRRYGPHGGRGYAELSPVQTGAALAFSSRCRSRWCTPGVQGPARR